MRVESNGLDIHYIAPRGLPTANSKVVLLVHGAGGSTNHFDAVIPLLAPELVPIALDLPGQGESGGTVPDSVEELVTCIDTFLTATGITGPICYVGHSFGGLIGLKFALTYPDRVSSLVLVASAARLRFHPDFIEQASSRNWNLDLLRNSFSPEIPEDHQQLVLNDLPKLRLPAGSDTLTKWGDVDLRPELNRINVPVLCMVPTDDVIVSPRNGRLLAREIPGAILREAPGAGHYLNVERPEFLADEINGFLVASALTASSGERG